MDTIFLALEGLDYHFNEFLFYWSRTVEESKAEVDLIRDYWILMRSELPNRLFDYIMIILIIQN